MLVNNLKQASNMIIKMINSHNTLPLSLKDHKYCVHTSVLNGLLLQSHTFFSVRHVTYAI